MSRYIDADEAVTMIALQMPFIIQGFEDNKRTAQRIIGSIPSVDIVFCKECKYYEAKEDWCYWRDEYTEPEYFCSYGEVRDE